MTHQTYRKLVEDGFGALKKYPGAILDATFSTRSLRQFLRDECEKANVRLRVVELDVDPDEIKRRLRSRKNNVGEISDARLEDFEKLSATYESPSELAPDVIRVSKTRSVSNTVQAILLHLAEKQVVGTDRRAVR